MGQDRRSVAKKQHDHRMQRLEFLRAKRRRLVGHINKIDAELAEIRKSYGSSAQ